MKTVYHDLVIQKLDRAKQALAEAKTIQQTKRILDLAGAAEIYAKRQQLGDEAIGYAHAIKIEALKRLGEILKETPKHEGGRPLKTHSREESVLLIPTLADLGIQRKTSMLAQQLAELPNEQFKQVRDGILTLRAALRLAKRAKTVEAPTLPTDIYRVLYADPPWQYRDTRAGLTGLEGGPDRRATAATHHYPTLSAKDLCALSIRTMAAPDSVLWCWATFPLLPDAFTVIDAWGFTYKTGFVWKKQRGSFGHYHKADAELLLVATRGSCTPDAESRVSQLLEAPSEGHSRKPDAARRLIDTLYGHGPRIELFARRPAPAPWKIWGNEP